MPMNKSSEIICDLGWGSSAFQSLQASPVNLILSIHWHNYLKTKTATCL